MFPKVLVAWWILCTAVLVSPIVGSQMSSETGACHKAFSTAWSIANVVPDSCVSALDMVVEMGDAQEGLVAVLMRALEYPFVVVGPEVLLQSGGPVEGFGASVEWAVVGF